MSTVKVRFPAGHFYSPIVDPAQVEDYVSRTARGKQDVAIPGITIDPERMRTFWQRYVEPTADDPLKREPNKLTRYHWMNNSYGYGDATVLRSFIMAHKPRRIIEIGSGYSTACMLDTADDIGLDALRLTCIEPYPDRLKKLMREGDHARVAIREEPVQQVPIEVFASLEAGDFLFIDSTHVMKTGSDVHYELFHILPALAKGVLIHIHDIQFPFEYPNGWIHDENFSWNEIYAVQAFLMYNNTFEIDFFTNYFGRFHQALVGRMFPDLAQHPESLGGSLWLRKVEP